MVHALSATINCETIRPWCYLWGGADAIILRPRRRPRASRMEPPKHSIRPPLSFRLGAHARYACVNMHAHVCMFISFRLGAHARYACVNMHAHVCMFMSFRPGTPARCYEPRHACVHMHAHVCMFISCGPHLWGTGPWSSPLLGYWTLVLTSGPLSTEPSSSPHLSLGFYGMLRR